MGMTREERITKDYIQTLLAKQGYVTYSNIFSNFDLNLTANPGVIGFMEPSKGRIVVNRNITKEELISVIIRHEILHFFLEHEQRMVKKVAKKLGLNPNDLSLTELENVKKEIYKNKKFNIAGDYEISNRGYTDEDKEIIRNIELNGKILSGLVTEDKHPDWVDWTLEDMYDALNNEKKEQEQQNNQDKNDQQDQNNKDNSDSSSNDDGEGSENNSDDQDSGNQENSGGSGSSQTDDEDENDSSDEDNSTGGGGSSSDDESKEDEETDENDSSNGSGSDNDSDDSSTDDKSSNNDSNQDENSSSDSSSSEQDSKSKSNSRNGRSKKSEDEKDAEKTPQIGDRGDEDELAKEDEERNNQIEDERAEDGDDDYETDSSQGNDDSNGNGNGLVDKEVREKNRLEKIRRLLQDRDVASKIEDETETNVSRSRSRTAAQNAKKYRNSPIKKFEDSLQKFVKSEIGNERNKTWKKFNAGKDAVGLLGPSRATVRNKNIPLINVYFDRSGSWDEAKTAVGEQAIGTLNNYVRKKQIKIDLYYFANEVSDQDNNSLIGYGTRGEPILRHIQQTRPDNVIIMTDDDITDCTSNVTVPGAVWFLWKGGVSTNLQQHLKGRLETNDYYLD